MSSAEDAEFHDAIPDSDEELDTSISTGTGIGRDRDADSSTEKSQGPQEPANEAEAKSLRQSKAEEVKSPLEETVDTLIGEAMLGERDDYERTADDNGSDPASKGDNKDGRMDKDHAAADDRTVDRKSVSQLMDKLDEHNLEANLEEQFERLESAVDDVIEEAIFNQPVSKDDSAEDRRNGLVVEGMDTSSMDLVEGESLLAGEDEKSFEEKRSLSKYYHHPDNKLQMETKPERAAEERTQTSGSIFGSWGGVFSALSDIKTKASSHLDRLVDSFDPNVPEEDYQPVDGEQEGKEKSVKSLFDRLSPGGIKKIETSVGVSIEPASLSSSPTQSSVSSPCPSPSRSKDLSPIASSAKSIGQNIYSVGLNTLEILGKKTANIVVSTKERLVPMMDKLTLEAKKEQETIDRAELKKSFVQLFDEFSGNEALEKLQLASTEASMALKTKLKALNPAQLKQAQTRIKFIGVTLEEVRSAGSEPLKTIDLHQYCSLFEGENEEFALKLILGVQKSVLTLSQMSESIDQVRKRVESSIPPDTASLLLYLDRFHLAKMLSASLFLLYLSISDDEHVVHNLAIDLLRCLNRVSLTVENDLLEGKKKEAVSSLVDSDLSQARSIFQDGILTMTPRLKLARYVKDDSR